MCKHGRRLKDFEGLSCVEYLCVLDQNQMYQQL